MQYATGSRNVFVHQLACNLNRKGISLNEALSFILTDFGYDEKEVTQTVHSAYGNIHEFGKDENFESNRNTKNNTKKSDNQNLSPRAESRGDYYEEDDEDKPKPTQIDRLELFLSTRYVFRHNIVSGKLEFQYFGKKKWGAISGILNNLMGSYSRNIPADDLKKLCALGQKLGLDTLADMDRAYSEYDNLLRNSDQIGKVLVDASDKLKSITQGNEEFIKKHKNVYKEFTELASKYNLW